MEPIVIDRKTGKVISAPALTQEQRDKLWEQYAQSYVRRHPEIFEMPKQESTAGDKTEVR